jgi:HK97 family phage prohead protease
MAETAADVVKRLPLVLEKSAAPEYDARFVMSASSPDRVKDTIDPAAYRPHLRKRLIALWQHEREKPIGYWQNLQVVAGALVGEIKFASTALAQMVKTLIADGVPLGASIGFRGRGEPNDQGGVHFSELELLETSIVSVPAHPRAVQIAKQYGITLPDAAGQLPARERSASPSPSAVAARSPLQRKTMSKTISQLVVETQDAQVALVDKLAAESTKLGESAAGTDEFTTQKAIVDGIDAELQAVDGKLASLKSAEARLAAGAKPVTADAGEIATAAILKARGISKDTDHLLGKLALCVYESRVKSMAIDTVAAQRFPNSQALETLIKAAQNPAMTNVPGYAQELTRQTYGQFLELLRGKAILPQCVPAALSHSFDGASTIYVPTRLGGTASGVFRAEGAPIPVKGLTFSHVLLTPKNMGVILTATMEMLRRSAIDLAAYFENAMRDDTARALDLLFISNTAGTAISPAGARAGLTVADTRASTGATASAITTDIKVMVKALTANDMGDPSTTRWLMHPSNLIAVSMLLTATGSKQFPEAEQGRLAGYPIVTSTQMDPTIVLLIDFANFTFAIGAPQFMASEQATIHEEDTTPLPIGTPGAPATIAAPVRSLYQTNSWALRLLLDAVWAKLRAIGPVQELTAVAW